MTNAVSIEVGESPQALIDRYGATVDVNSKNEQAHGLSFYRLGWAPPELGAVAVRNDDTHLNLDMVLSVMGTYDAQHVQEGLSRYNVNLGLSVSETMPHDEARLKFFDLLTRIQQAGWKWYIYQANPRLTGADALAYQLQTFDASASLDPNFILDLEDWMKLDNGSAWRFYQNGVYMDVALTRDRKRMEPDKPGVYFINISLEAHTSKRRAAFSGDDRQRWQELLPALRQRQGIERAEAEKKLQVQGYTIDTQYENPDEPYAAPASPLAEQFHQHPWAASMAAG